MDNPLSREERTLRAMLDLARAVNHLRGGIDIALVVDCDNLLAECRAEHTTRPGD